MFVVNFKFNLKKVLTVCIVVAIVSAVVIEFIASGGNFKAEETMKKDDTKYDYVLTEENFTQVLKAIHDDITGNVNKTIKITGFVFRMPDFKEDIFVCGRNTIVNNEDNVAGFLCQLKDAKNLKDSEWVEITGVIQQGTYNTEMPVIKVGSVKKVTAPANTFVN